MRWGCCWVGAGWLLDDWLAAHTQGALRPAAPTPLLPFCLTTWLPARPAGPNMSGKSTYLRQVALCVVMAQVGAFVPAAFASLAPCDRLLTRLGTGDSLETCSSSFMVEMQVRVLAEVLAGGGAGVGAGR